ncbi:hypothetical protein [Nocardioides jiangxiensis]|uniref:Uncharacterized protein n=1 Tax=Nocardioides jiangxiensis TaxID=3064524 RepID=A0ABT9B2N3_9ACTN|nr:hypothetical protein [Nocardioides sp. WY-20]MDO7869104.1 hypothetical protein [Nocardioides sp. WY-20]
MVFQVPRQRVAALVDSWATAAQQQACRNAMVASTALARTRAQRIVVEEFLAARLGARSEVSGSAAGALPPDAPEADPLPPTLSQVAD